MENEKDKYKEAEIKAFNFFDQREVIHNCTVEILTNSVTGEQSIGWYREGTYIDE